MNPMIITSLPVFLTILAVLGLSMILLTIGWVLNPKQRVGPVQQMPYESGMDPIHDTRRRFDVRFHLLAIAFLVFDVELLFLYPWAVALHPAPPASRSIADDSEIALADLSDKKREKAPAKAVDDSVEAAKIEDARIAVPKVVAGIDAVISDGVVPGLAPNRHLPFIGAMSFFVLLALGFVYDWRKGVFQWR
jgi:NADH-quinone oxidoreductase subunit A